MGQFLGPDTDIRGERYYIKYFDMESKYLVMRRTHFGYKIETEFAGTAA